MRPNTKMNFDTKTYLASLEEFQQAMGVSFNEAEKELFPVRAAKRRIALQERRELQATTIKKN